MTRFHRCNHHVHLDWINVLIYLIWPIIFFAGWIIVPRLMVLLMSVCGLICLCLLKSDEKYEHEQN